MGDEWRMVESGWWEHSEYGSVRDSDSYRAGGWWLLSKQLPDEREYDIGPFKTKAEAMMRAISGGQDG